MSFRSIYHISANLNDISDEQILFCLGSAHKGCIPHLRHSISELSSQCVRDLKCSATFNHNSLRQTSPQPLIEIHSLVFNYSFIASFPYTYACDPRFMVMSDVFVMRLVS